jgi:glycosyltransferase involved in cell wall biosynthesis
VNHRNPQSIGLIWSQYAAYHVDRCEAVARRFAGRAEVLAIEVATTSTTYAWEPSGEIPGARKITLFPGRSYDAISVWARYIALLRSVRGCDVVCLGLSYGEAESIMLSWTLRLMGKLVIVFSESKFDDSTRSVWKECGKSLALSCYGGAIVGGRRHRDYFRFLRFIRRPVLPGYDVVGTERIRRQSGAVLAPGGAAWAGRPFVFVGRFVDKKNLLGLIAGYARYASVAGNDARRLVLVGAGEEEAAMRALAESLGVAELVDFPGFLGAEAVSRVLAEALALVLPSREEQWGLVVNEALALGLPAIVSGEVGSRDLLVRNLVNGYVVESNSPDGLASAMRELSTDEGLWRAMVAQSHARAWMGDSDRLADALECLLYTDSAEARQNVARLTEEMEIPADV